MNDGTATLTATSDSESCHVGSARLTNGILNIQLQQNQIIITTNAELGAQSPDCGTCYWKNYNFSVNSPWFKGDTVTIKAGKDVLKIAYGQPFVTACPSGTMTNTQKFWYKVQENSLIFHVSSTDFKNISIFDISGRRILSQSVAMQSTVSIPRSFSQSMLFIELACMDGTIRRMALPAVN